MFKTAIVGCGAISKTHAKSLKLVQNATIAAFCDPIFERAEKNADEYGGVAYRSLEEALEKEKIDVIHVCAPHYLHVPITKTALQRGINVLMEKPPAITREQFEELKAADKGAARLGICFQNRYNESVIAAKKLLESGECGKVLGARGIVTWSRDEKYYSTSGWRGQLEKEGGGVLINQSIHTLDLITYMLGMPSRVSATSANYHLKGVIDVEDSISAFLEFGDATAIFFATTAHCKDAPILLEFACEKATIRIEGNTLRVARADGKTEFADYSTTSSGGKACWGSSHGKLISEFYSRLESGEQFPVDLDSVKESFYAMTAIYDSAKYGKTIELGEK